MMPQVKRQSHRTKNILQRDRVALRRSGNNSTCSNHYVQFKNYSFTLDANAIKAGKVFDSDCGKIALKLCSNCNRMSADLIIKNNKCSSCNKNSNKFSVLNNIDPGSVPEELQGLTYIEQMVISQVHPVVSLYRIRGAQYGYSGHIISFKRNTNEYTKLLPIHPSKLSSTIVFKKNTPSGFAEFRVRAEKVKNALLGLKEHNMYYKDIKIDVSTLNLLPEDGDVSNMLPSLNIENNEFDNDNELNESFIPIFNKINQENVINDELHLNYPSTSDDPINEFLDEGYIVKEFPALFPLGIGDFLHSRDVKVTWDEYFKYLMEYKDRRFSNDPRFRYFALNTLLRHKCMERTNVYIKKSEFNSLKVSDLKEKLINQPHLLKNVMVHCSNIRSSKSYWRQRCQELLQMVEQLGKPTIFFTLSAADYHWSDLYTFICPDKNINDLTDKEKRKIMHDNPNLVGYFFQKRVSLFMKNIIIPIFNVSDWWYRYEWQARGSPHIHGLLWIKDAPQFNEDELSEDKLQELKVYFDKLCFAENYPEGDETEHPSKINFSNVEANDYERDLSRLLNTFQRHTQHGKHCLRTKRGTNVIQCRFKFPKEIKNESEVTYSEGHYQYHPKRNDAYIQRYNNVITQIWRGNTDFSPVMTLKSVINYIAKYAAKEEISSKFYDEILKTICDKFDDDQPAKKAILKLILSTVGERDFSAQEVMHILMGWPMFHCSRSFTILHIKDDEWKKLQVSEDNLTNNSNSLIQKYIERPSNLKNLSLFDFASKINFHGKKYWTARKEKVVIVYPKIKLSGIEIEDEKFYKIQSILNVPFEGNFNNLLKDTDELNSWKKIFNHYQLSVNNELQLSNDLEDEGEIIEESVDGIQQDLFEKLAGCVQESENEIVGQRLIDLQNDWNATNVNYPSLKEVDEFLKSYKNLPLPSVNQQSNNTIFSVEQTKVLNILDQQICKINNTNVTNESDLFDRIIVHGKAGCGKSTVIKEMVRRVALHFTEDAIVVSAPTGVAAVNIDGNTLHSVFKLPFDHKLFTPLNGESLRNFQLKFKNLKFLIIDEISMVGCKMLSVVEKRCREIYPQIDSPFGGIKVYLFGDFRQLPPVMDTPLYETSNNSTALHGSFIFKTFKKCIELKISQRQNEDLYFSNLLDNLAKGSLTESEYNMLSSRREAILSQNEKKSFSEAVYLFPMNKMVREQNEIYLKNLKKPVARIKAVSKPNIMAHSSGDTAMGLSGILNLAVGCRIMLRSNLWVAGGLVNGTLGTVADIIFDEDHKPPSLPLYVLIQFDNYKGPCIYDKLFPIKPIVRKWSQRGLTCTRQQFPIKALRMLLLYIKVKD